MNHKNQYLKALLLTLLMLCFPIISGVIIAVMSLTGTAVIMIQTIAFTIAFLVGLLIALIIADSVKSVGLKTCEIRHHKHYLWFLPLIVVEVIPYFFGLQVGLSTSQILLYIIFALVVGFTEELYFRGLIIHLLEDKKASVIIIVSSLLFSVSHLANLLSGQDVLSTAMQVIFALLFAIVAAEIALSTKSIVIPAIWHTIHNFSAMITAQNDGTFSFIVVGLQGFILFLYAIYLWKENINQLKSSIPY